MRRGGEAVNTTVCKTVMHRFESGSRLKAMAEIERNISPKQAEWLLKGTALAIATIGIMLVPTLGAVGAVDFILGAGMFALVEKQKRNKQNK